MPQHRNPQQSEIEIYRTQPASYLKVFGEKVIETERANILAEGLNQATAAIISAVESARMQVSAQVRSATGFWWPGVVVGVVGWLISIALTVLAVYSAPDWVSGLVRHLAGR